MRDQACGQTGVWSKDGKKEREGVMLKDSGRATFARCVGRTEFWILVWRPEHRRLRYPWAVNGS